MAVFSDLFKDAGLNQSVGNYVQFCPQRVSNFSIRSPSPVLLCPCAVALACPSAPCGTFLSLCRQTKRIQPPSFVLRIWLQLYGRRYLYGPHNRIGPPLHRCESSLAHQQHSPSGRRVRLKRRKGLGSPFVVFVVWRKLLYCAGRVTGRCAQYALYSTST